MKKLTMAHQDYQRVAKASRAPRFSARDIREREIEREEEGDKLREGKAVRSPLEGKNPPCGCHNFKTGMTGLCLSDFFILLKRGFTMKPTNLVALWSPPCSLPLHLFVSLSSLISIMEDCSDRRRAIPPPSLPPFFSLFSFSVFSFFQVGSDPVQGHPTHRGMPTRTTGWPT